MTAETRPLQRRRRRVAVDVALWIAAGAGVICIALVIIATLFHVTLIMFSTGSMSPTIPTGSLAVVHRIPASEIRVGDIVTVDRVGELPITHRVTSVHAGPVSSERVITMKGDANLAPDPAPYTVATVRIVWWSVPGLAYVVVWFANPFVLGAIAIAVAALVTWAFWPREPKGRQPGPSEPDARAGLRGAGVAGAVLLLAVIPVVTQAPPASAAPTETVVHSRYLTLTSLLDADAASSLSPESPLDWQVGVSAAPPSTGLVHVGLGLDDPPADASGLDVTVAACAQPWSGETCASGAATWLARTPITSAVIPATDFDARELGTSSTTHPVWVLVRVIRSESAQIGTTAALRLQVWAEGDDAAVGSGDTGALSLTNGLPTTGISGDPVGAALAAGGAVALGVGIAAAARRIKRRATP